MSKVPAVKETARNFKGTYGDVMKNIAGIALFDKRQEKYSMISGAGIGITLFLFVVTFFFFYLWSVYIFVPLLLISLVARVYFQSRDIEDRKHEAPYNFLKMLENDLAPGSEIEFTGNFSDYYSFTKPVENTRDETFDFLWFSLKAVLRNGCSLRLQVFEKGEIRRKKTRKKSKETIKLQNSMRLKFKCSKMNIPDNVSEILTHPSLHGEIKVNSGNGTVTFKYKPAAKYISRNYASMPVVGEEYLVKHEELGLLYLKACEFLRIKK